MIAPLKWNIGIVTAFKFIKAGMKAELIFDDTDNIWIDHLTVILGGSLNLSYFDSFIVPNGVRLGMDYGVVTKFAGQ